MISRSMVAALLATLAACLTIASARAAIAVTAAPTSARPTQQLTIAGTSFGATEAVDLYFDTTDTVLLTTASDGSFSGPLTLPASASPGTHYVTAVGRHSGIAAQAAVTVTTNWTAYGFSAAHTNSNPYENTINTSNAANLGVLWTASGAQPVLAAPVYYAGRVYTAGNAGVWAYVSTTGAKSWAAYTSEAFYATPAVVGGMVYIGSASTSNVYAIDATTGAKKWTFAMGAPTRSSAVVANNIVYIGSNDDKVYALNASTGALIWSYTTGSQVAAQPAVYDGVVYVGSLMINFTHSAPLQAVFSGATRPATPSLVAQRSKIMSSCSDHMMTKSMPLKPALPVAV